MQAVLWERLPKNASSFLVTEIDYVDAGINSGTVLRLARKMFGRDEVLDLRLWRRTKDGKLYPSRRGLCMKTEFWPYAFELFAKLGVSLERTTNKKLEGQA